MEDGSAFSAEVGLAEGSGKEELVEVKGGGDDGLVDARLGWQRLEVVVSHHWSSGMDEVQVVEDALDSLGFSALLATLPPRG